MYMLDHALLRPSSFLFCSDVHCSCRFRDSDIKFTFIHLNTSNLLGVLPNDVITAFEELTDDLIPKEKLTHALSLSVHSDSIINARLVYYS